jgi:hypothetical protein
MPKKRTLNGLPHNLVKSYFSTLRYWKVGYMADWLYNAATARKVKTVTLDIIHSKIDPVEMEILPLMYHLRELKTIIEKELTQNGFDKGFITQARIDIKITSTDLYAKALKCSPELSDKDGRVYKTSPILEFAFEDFDPSFFMSDSAQ